MVAAGSPLIGMTGSLVGTHRCSIELLIRPANDLLLTTKTGHQLRESAVKRAVVWSAVAPGRRIHDLRHTAACLWLSKGVDPVTVPV
jgi:integrase